MMNQFEAAHIGEYTIITGENAGLASNRAGINNAAVLYTLDYAHTGGTIRNNVTDSAWLRSASAISMPETRQAYMAAGSELRQAAASDLSAFNGGDIKAGIREASKYTRATLAAFVMASATDVSSGQWLVSNTFLADIAKNSVYSGPLDPERGFNGNKPMAPAWAVQYVKPVLARYMLPSAFLFERRVGARIKSSLS